MKRVCLAKRLYEAGTPYIQILGWLPIFCSCLYGAYVAFNFIGDTQAAVKAAPMIESRLNGHDSDIAALKKGQDDFRETQNHMSETLDKIYGHLIRDAQPRRR